MSRSQGKSDLEDFFADGTSTLEAIARYWEALQDAPVRPEVEPGAIDRMMPREAPDEALPFADALEQLTALVEPGLVGWQSPRWHAFWPANGGPASLFGDMLSAGYGQQGMLWATSPACTEVEARVVDWLRILLGLPERFSIDGQGGGVIQDSASSATLLAMLAAREKAGTESVREHGVGHQRWVSYVSELAHSSFERAAMIAGLGRLSVRKVPTDALLGMDAHALDQMIQEDKAAGLKPFFVGATIGTTACGSSDDLRTIGPIAKSEHMWLHVDAAMNGAAALCPEHRAMHQGIEHVDSWCFNPHKWLPVHFDCDVFWVANRNDLINAMSVNPEYLKNDATEQGGVIDYRDWQIPLGRRFRALKLWLTLYTEGAEQLRKTIRKHIAFSRNFADKLKQLDVDVLVPQTLGLVAFAAKDNDSTEELQRRINHSRKTWLTHAEIQGRRWIRVAIGAWRTEEHHMDQLYKEIEAAIKTDV